MTPPSASRATPLPDDAVEALAVLLTAAHDDDALRARLLAVVRLPRVHREPLIRTALDEMVLRGEPEPLRRAFAVLIDDDGAQRVRLALGEGG